MSEDSVLSTAITTHPEKCDKISYYAQNFPHASQRNQMAYKVLVKHHKYYDDRIFKNAFVTGTKCVIQYDETGHQSSPDPNRSSNS